MIGWTLTTGRHRCKRCRRLVEKTWRYYSTPSTATLAFCEPCVEEIIRNGPELVEVWASTEETA